jgi:Ig-like domain-containing protein
MSHAANGTRSKRSARIATVICVLLLFGQSAVTATPASAQPVLPTPAPVSGDCLRFVADVTVPDGTPVIPADTVEKAWRLSNCGDTTWDGYQAEKIGGNYGPATINVPRTPPGATLDLSAQMQVPDIAGVHRAVYQLRGPGGSFGGSFFVEVAIPDCNFTEESAADLTVPRSALGEEWCPIPVPNERQMLYSVQQARYANMSDYSTPRQATFWIMVAPSRERVLNPLMVLADLVLGQPSGGPGSTADMVELGDGPALKLVRVAPDGGTGGVYYSFTVDTANVVVSVSGTAGDELSTLAEQAYGFASLQEQRLRDEAHVAIAD